MQGKSNTDITFIDVSHHNGSIDWQRVPNTGVKAVYIKSSEGVGVADDTFAGHVHYAKMFGLAVGAYHFARPEYNSDPIQEANFFLSVIDGHDLDLMPCLDLESPANFSPDMSAAYLSNWARQFVNYVQEKTGRKVIIYTGKWYTDQYGIYGLNDQPLWISKYSDVPPADCAGWTEWVGWQYTESGQIDGVGTCDVNVAVSLDSLRGGYVSSQPQVQQIQQSQAQVQEPSLNIGALGIVTITADALNLRVEPDANSTIIRTLNNGETYLYYGSQNGWQNLGGGFVNGKYTSYKPGKATVIASTLNVRSGASADSSIVDTVHNGDTLQVWGRYGNWIEVGTDRFVYGAYVTIQP